VAMQLTFLGIKSNKYIPWFPSVFPSDELFLYLRSHLCNVQLVI
jgi:hypothetical protein